MNRCLACLTCACLVAGNLCRAEEATEFPKKLPTTIEEKATFMILVADRDGDGKIARTEVPGPVYRDNFDRFDTDGDGILNRAEIRGAARTLTMSASMLESFREGLVKLDNNKDGSVSREEAAADAALDKNFDRWDLDGDSSLSEFEVAARVRTRQVIAFQRQNRAAGGRGRRVARKPFNGWIGKRWSAVSATGEYAVGFDRSVARTGDRSAYIRATEGARNFASFGQGVQAIDFKGKRVELSAYIKTEDIPQGTGNTGLWLRCDGSLTWRAFDNMMDRGFKGTGDWQKATVVLDIPDDAVKLVLGGLHEGTGTAWFDDFELRVVDETTEVTKPTTVDERIQLSEEDRASMLANTEKTNPRSLENTSFEVPARVLGVGVAEGEITTVVAGSLAARLGIKKGDRVANLNGQAITTALDLRKAMYGGPSKHELHLVRDGDELTFTFTAAETEPTYPNASELKVAPLPGPGGRRRGNFVNTILGRSDTDEDGKLSGEEIPPFLGRFVDDLDKDGDGALAKEELEKLPELMRSLRGTRSR